MTYYMCCQCADRREENDTPQRGAVRSRPVPARGFQRNRSARWHAREARSPWPRPCLHERGCGLCERTRRWGRLGDTAQPLWPQPPQRAQPTYLRALSSHAPVCVLPGKPRHGRPPGVSAECCDPGATTAASAPLSSRFVSTRRLPVFLLHPQPQRARTQHLSARRRPACQAIVVLLITGKNRTRRTRGLPACQSCHGAGLCPPPEP